MPPRPRLRFFGSRLGALTTLWAWPLVLSLLVVLGVMGWLRAQEVNDLDTQRAAMISDALSLEAQINARLDGELARLRLLADAIDAGKVRPAQFSGHPLVLDGLRRFWVSVTWLGDAGRIMAHVPDDSIPANDLSRRIGDEGGLAGHLSVSLIGHGDHAAGLLVARYSAAALLREKVPWWLASKYDIRLVDVTIFYPILLLPEDGPMLPQLLMSNPGAFFIPRNRVRALLYSRGKWTIDRSRGKDLVLLEDPEDRQFSERILELRNTVEWRSPLSH